MKVQPGSSSKSCLGQGRAAGEEREESLPRCTLACLCMSVLCVICPSRPRTGRPSPSSRAALCTTWQRFMEDGRTATARWIHPSLRPSVHPEAKAPTFLAVLRAMRASGAGPGRRGRWAFLPSFLPHGEISEISKTYFSTGRCSSSE